MADEEKPQRGKTKKAAVKKKATVKKRATPKKAVAKKAAPKKTSAKKRVAKKATPKKTQPPSAVAIPPAQATQGTTERPAEKTTSAPQPEKSATEQAPQTSAVTRRVWWRVAIMVVIVIGVFAYIRNIAHTGDGVTAKSTAPSPWATPEPETDAMQPHPWELAPEPQTGNAANQRPYSVPQKRNEYPRLEPWQPPREDAGQPSQPYYPPPPGYYGYPSSDGDTAPYQR